MSTPTLETRDGSSAPDNGEIRLSIGSRFENIELVQAVVEDSLQRLKFDDDTRHWIGIAVREALANAIKHGNRQDPEKTVEVELIQTEEEFLIRVADQGSGFDPAGVDDPLNPDNLLKPCGRGIFYMNKFMDGIEYDFAEGGGTQVTLRKRIGSDPTEKENGQ